jgi:hypothetical protein
MVIALNGSNFMGADEERDYLRYPAAVAFCTACAYQGLSSRHDWKGSYGTSRNENFDLLGFSGDGVEASDSMVRRTSRIVKVWEKKAPQTCQIASQ